jgi:hypothetical protein
LTVTELVQSIAAGIEGSELASHLVIAPEGHVRLADDLDEDEDEPEPALLPSIDDIIKEVQEYGRGKRRRTKSSRYGPEFEAS